MPEKSQTIFLPHDNPDENMAMVYGAFSRLGWNTKYAGEIAIISYTTRSWKGYGLQVTAVVERNLLTVTSKMIRGESFDLLKKNQKNIDAFINAFENVQINHSNTDMDSWKQSVRFLQEQTVVAAKNEK